MSRKSDASPTSEAECSGSAPEAMSGEAEMLPFADRRAPSQCENAVVPEKAKLAQVEDHDASFDLPGAPPLRMGPTSSAAAEHSNAEALLDPFEHFQSLQVSLSPHIRLVSLTDSGSPAAEAFRLLGVRMRHLRRDRALKKVLITSTIPQEGKSTVAANLACTLGLGTQQKTLLLEGDLRRPSLSQMFGLRRNPGICEWLEGNCSLTASVYHLEGPNIWILPAGSSSSNALELLQSGQLSTLLDRLNAWFDWIIIDSPPVLPLADTSVWMRLADGILLTTRQGTTEKRQLQRGLEAVESKKLIGALVNSSTHAAASDYYYYGPVSVSRSDDASAR
jgi:capsular exopolysaccharide synthesis family protein